MLLETGIGSVGMRFRVVNAACCVVIALRLCFSCVGRLLARGVCECALAVTSFRLSASAGLGGGACA